MIIYRNDGTCIEVRRCDEFVYNGQWIYTISSYEELVKKNIRLVQGIKGYCDMWDEDTRLDGVVRVT